MNPATIEPVKVAYFCEPQIGGTYSFFTRVRTHLKQRGIDFRCIPPFSAERFVGSRFAGLDGVEYISFPDHDMPKATRVLIDYLLNNNFNAIMVLPGSDIVAVNLVRYLPQCIYAIARVPMITRGVYAPTKALECYFNKIIGVSDRVKVDLVRRYGVCENKVSVIYNGADIDEYRPDSACSRSQPSVFRILYSGRLSDLDKGVLLLPDIMRRVCDAGVDVHLVVAGSGPDEDALRKAFDRAGVTNRVTLLGSQTAEEVAMLLRQADCFILPSRFEGCPNALMEAMGSSCACVAARIQGSVDQIVEHGKSGLLAVVADPSSFALAIIRLARDPLLRSKLGEGARARIQDCFTVEHTAEGYAHVLLSLGATSDRRPPPLPIDYYSVPRSMLPTWRTGIPVPIKNFARKWLERMGISS